MNLPKVNEGAPPQSTNQQRFLFLDDRVVEFATNAELTLGTVAKHPANPLFSEDQPWEMRFDNLYANVLYDDDDQLYKCWYSPFIVDRSARGLSVQRRAETPYRAPPNREMGLCYATSIDGLEWEKPALGLVDYKGSKRNNIVWRGGENGVPASGPHGMGVFKDLSESDPRRRYKAILKSNTLAFAFSDDGIRWGQAIACRTADSAGDTHNNAFWAPTLGRYVGITRLWSERHVRQVGRTASDDFVNWDRVKPVLESSDAQCQTYAMPVLFHGGVYLGLLAVHDQITDRVWTELAWSSDTTAWQRVAPGTPLVPNGECVGTYDWGCVYAAALPLVGKDEIRIYYGGSDGLHTSWRNGYFCLATLRPDGFAGYKCINTSQQAILRTMPVCTRDQSVRVSADIGEGASLVVRLLGEHAQSLAESEPITGSVTDELVVWRDRGSLLEDSISKLQLQFEFTGGTLYSFTLGTDLHKQ